MSVGEQYLGTLCKRQSIPVPLPEYRGNARTRCLGRFTEVHQRWEGLDPKSYKEIIEWFRGKNDVPGKPKGADVWLALCAWCGRPAVPYEDIPGSMATPEGRLKLTIEHWMSQAMVGDTTVYLNGIAWLDVLEFAINNSKDFKQVDSMAQCAMIGDKATAMRRAQMRWTDTGNHSQLPSSLWYRSAHYTGDPLISIMTGLPTACRSWLQGILPFAPANFTRNAATRRPSLVQPKDTAAPPNTPEEAEPEEEPRIVEVETTDAETQTRWSGDLPQHIFDMMDAWYTGEPDEAPAPDPIAAEEKPIDPKSKAKQKLSELPVALGGYKGLDEDESRLQMEADKRIKSGARKRGSGTAGMMETSFCNRIVDVTAFRATRHLAPGEWMGLCDMHVNKLTPELLRRCKQRHGGVRAAFGICDGQGQTGCKQRRQNKHEVDFRGHKVSGTFCNRDCAVALATKEYFAKKREREEKVELV